MQILTGKQSSSLNDGFVPYEETKTIRYKYHLFLNRCRYSDIKRFCNTELSKLKGWLNQINAKQLLKDGLEWLVEAFIEGLPTNFATYYLLNLKFSIPMIIAHGCAIKMLLYIVKEIKNGSTTKVLQNK